MSERRFTHTWFSALLILGALVIVSLSLPFTVLADDSSIGTLGGSVHPIWTTNVRMAAETVQATCFGDCAEYRVDFEFVNNGPARAVKLGFPFTDTSGAEEDASPPVGFQAWQDGRPLVVTTVASKWMSKGQVGYFVHTAHFRHGTTMITVSYLAAPGGSTETRRRGASSGGWNGAYQYWLHTGSTWKGTIGKAVLRYRLADTFQGTDIELPATEVAKDASVTSPPGWTTPLSRTYQWQFSDFEPWTTHTKGWWEPQSPFDVTLAFSKDPERVASIPAKWTVSSNTGEAAGDGYAPEGILGDGWFEGAPGLGIGQWVQARFKQPVHLRELRILPGDTEYGSAFRRFARPETLLAVFSNGTSTVLHFRDAPSLQRFPVNVTTRWVRLVIRSVYAGTDYPGTCIAGVEFGTQRAPGYAPFRRLIGDPAATGRLTAWAGPPAPTPRASLGKVGPSETWRVDESAAATDQQALSDYEERAGGDLIGVSDWAMTDDPSFPAKAAFKEPSSMVTLRTQDPSLRLPDARLVGRVTSISALSYQTFEVSYASGVELLVNTRAGAWPRSSLSSALKDETEIMDTYADGRKTPFAITRIGPRTVGLGQPGLVTAAESSTGDDHVVRGQLFWYANGVSYHLYAPVGAKTSDSLITAARSMIVPPPAAKAGSHASSSVAVWWIVGGAAGVALVAAVIAAGLRKRRAASSHPVTP